MYGQLMPEPQPFITAAEATRRLGYKHRSSLTRLVQRGVIKPAFVGSGKTGEQWFNPAEVEALVAKGDAA